MVKIMNKIYETGDSQQAGRRICYTLYTRGRGIKKNAANYRGIFISFGIKQKKEETG
jgi:hypothetical protein